MTLTYNVYKVSEGGLGGKEAKAIALQCGATKVQQVPSIYVGQTAIVVTAPSRVHDKIINRLY